MRVSGWRGKKVFTEIAELALVNANLVMDDVVEDAKQRCPTLKSAPREGKFAGADVSFTIKKGKNKGKLVAFRTEKRWMGREPGDLRSTIRRVTKPRTGNIRIYAGNFKIYWAFMVEMGTSRTAAQAFLRPAFHAKKKDVIAMIKNGK